MTQLVEHSPSTQNVAGSNPARGSSFFLSRKKGVVFGRSCLLCLVSLNEFTCTYAVHVVAPTAGHVQSVACACLVSGPMQCTCHAHMLPRCCPSSAVATGALSTHLSLPLSPSSVPPPPLLPPFSCLHCHPCMCLTDVCAPAAADDGVTMTTVDIKKPKRYKGNHVRGREEGVCRGRRVWEGGDQRRCHRVKRFTYYDHVRHI